MCAAQLPGRDGLFRKPPLTDMPALIQWLAVQLIPRLDVPFAIFGHSLGALVAYEFARELRRRGGPAPVHLFVSASAAPHLRPARPAIHQLPRPAFISMMQLRYNAIPQAVLDEPDLLEMLLPVLQADVTVFETYRCTEEAPLSCPMSAFGGTTDGTLSAESVAAWSKHTDDDFSMHMLTGGHFFLQDSRAALLEAISLKLEAHLEPTTNT